MKKVELVAPAGDLLKLKVAFLYGADAVYASLPKFAMRTREIRFNQKTLAEGIKYTHQIGKKIYLTINCFPHSTQIKAITKHIDQMINLKPDGLIVADPGIVDYIISNYQIPVHLSTQANTTNQLTAKFWQNNKVKRLVLARELNLKDIKLITNCTKIPIEVFVHGAMCMAYSGRCQISNYFANRDPNMGQCLQACRFKYKLFNVIEDSRPNDNYPIIEEENGTYLFNSKDLCMIDHIPDLIKAGVSALKIEGRLKSEYYVGTIVRAYRQAIDDYYQNSKIYLKNVKTYLKEIIKSTNRGFTTGFYYNKPDKSTNNYSTSKVWGTDQYVGIVDKYNSSKKHVAILVKDPIKLGDNLEFVLPNKIIFYKVKNIYNKNYSIKKATPSMLINLPADEPIMPNILVRRKIDNNKIN